MNSPALSLAIPALFGAIKPTLTAVKKLGFTDFSAAAPTIDIKPGATIKVPVSSISAAVAYNESTNNYLTGGSTDWATLSATHYLQGFDITGTNLDQGVDAAKVKQLFSVRAGAGIAAAIQNACKSALDSVTASTAVKIHAASTVTVDEYLALGDGVDFLDKATSVLAVNGAELASIKAKLAANHIVTANLTEIGQMLGFADCVLIPGMTARACIVPASSMGLMARVPAIIADYKEVGTETDEDTGLSVGIVVASDQAKNRLICNGDIWFGATVQSANAAATTAGVIKVGTAA